MWLPKLLISGGVALIVCGLGWAAVSYLAATMASRSVNVLREVVWPMSWALIPVAGGVILLRIAKELLCHR